MPVTALNVSIALVGGYIVRTIAGRVGCRRSSCNRSTQEKPVMEEAPILPADPVPVHSVGGEFKNRIYRSMQPNNRIWAMPRLLS
ncbi:hypothetical protein JTE90_024767 [Oedothorax gibbosus]|nr:hypothetical protein JTE90_024767 [Oedothorax gibbosus]